MKQKQQAISRFFAPKAALIEPPSPAPRPSPTSAVQWPPAKTSRNLQNRGASPSPTKKLDRKRPIPPVSGKDETSQVVDLCRPEFCSGAVSLNESAPDSPNHNGSSDLNSTDLHSTYKRRRKKEDYTEGHQHSSSVTGEENSQSLSLKKVKSGNSVVNGVQEYLPSKSSEIADIPASDPARHQKFIERLLTTMDSERQASKPNKGLHKSDYTPLEQQVVELKAKYKDVLLMVEVGYRYRMFGEDAEIAARVLGIFAYNDHNFITASIPTFRLHVHVRRLVEAGYKVGVVRQMETAAIKAHGGNKLGPFTRGLSALYSRATLEAAADLGGSETFTETENSTTKFLMCVVEQVDTLKASAKSPLHKHGSSAKLDFESEAVSKSAYDTTIGVVAVETASGDVMYGQFKDTVTRSELEAHLLSCLPAELILASPLASSTEKGLQSPRQQVVKTPSRAPSSKGFVAFGHDTVNDDKEKVCMVEQPPLSIGHRQPCTHVLVNGQDSSDQAMIRPPPALHGFMPDSTYGAMQADSSNPIYGNIGAKPGFQCAVGSYGMPGTNMGMAGFSQPYAQNMDMTGKASGTSGSGMPLLNAIQAV
ncbi:hypothetical protein L7F22_030650 [Adiantum nelumboides]|nr:hypothetical protein [Adiantum nelumboides]